MPSKVKKYFICGMRGRDSDKPPNRCTKGKKLKQRLEINKDGLCNTLTSFTKDNIVLEIYEKEKI